MGSMRKRDHLDVEFERSYLVVLGSCTVLLSLILLASGSGSLFWVGAATLIAGAITIWIGGWCRDIVVFWVSIFVCPITWFRWRIVE